MRVAAVCYQQRGMTEFLLVRTTGGKRWTFPKGHVKRGESPSHAALREAQEEAGAIGYLDPRPLGRYAYAGGSGPSSETSEPVTAFLVKVSKLEAPEEVCRRPTWFTAAQAKKELAKSRSQAHAEEHARIIDAAIQRLRP